MSLTSVGESAESFGPSVKGTTTESSCVFSTEDRFIVGSTTASSVEERIVAAVNNVIAVQTYVTESINVPSIESATAGPSVEVESLFNAEFSSSPYNDLIVENQVEVLGVTPEETSIVQSVSSEPRDVAPIVNPSAEGAVHIDSSVVFTESNTDMAATQLRRLAADLETIMFQIDEIHDGIDTLHGSYNSKSQTLKELKELRISMVKTKKELDFTRVEMHTIMMKGMKSCYHQRNRISMFSNLQFLGPSTLKSWISICWAEITGIFHCNIPLERPVNKKWMAY